MTLHSTGNRGQNGATRSFEVRLQTLLSSFVRRKRKCTRCANVTAEKFDRYRYRRTSFPIVSPRDTVYGRQNATPGQNSHAGGASCRGYRLESRKLCYLQGSDDLMQFTVNSDRDLLQWKQKRITCQWKVDNRCRR